MAEDSNLPIRSCWSCVMRTGLIAKALFFQLLLASCDRSRMPAAPCVAPPASAEMMDQFKANPRSIIASSVDTRSVESSVTRPRREPTPRSRKSWLACCRTRTPRFRTAIAAGLAQAAIACSTVDQEAGTADPASGGQRRGRRIPGVLCCGRRRHLDRCDGSRSWLRPRPPSAA